MNNVTEDFYRAFQAWGEDSDVPGIGDENQAQELLEELSNRDVALLPAAALSELRQAAKTGYQWPAPLGYPAHLPTTQYEQYYCLTERFPKEAMLLMWGDGENPAEWCEWDGDNYVPTTHEVLGFWPTPVAPAGTAEGLRKPAPAPIGKEEGSPAAELEALRKTAYIRLPLQVGVNPEDPDTISDADGWIVAETLGRFPGQEPNVAKYIAAAVNATAAPAAGASPVGGPAAEVAGFHSVELADISAWITWVHSQNKQAGELLRRFFNDARQGKAITEYNDVAPLPAAAPSLLGGGVAIENKGVALIAAERSRQIQREGWDASHDDEHKYGCLLHAAYAYLLAQRAIAAHTDASAADRWLEAAKDHWPWEAKWFKPSTDYRRNLAKAGALIAAEIDRLERVAPTQVAIGGSSHE